ncbi:exported hypothetical protein [Burkholderiales bacterium 8X]|nr:exported hypothetical protein [Burkholderiales bacterium 8X]
MVRMGASKVAVLRGLLLVMICWNVTCVSSATCTLPWPDTFRPGTSNPNVVGRVIAMNSLQIELQTKKGRQRIGLPQTGVYYTAFGGDDRVERLKLGVVARAWYVDCRVPENGATPRAAYLEVYSNDPRDQPPPKYWKHY